MDAPFSGPLWSVTAILDMQAKKELLNTKTYLDPELQNILMIVSELPIVSEAMEALLRTTTLKLSR